MEVKINVRRIIRNIIVGILLFVVFLLPLFIRSLYESHRSLAAARMAIEHADAPLAISEFGRAIRWRGVFNPFAQQAIEELTTYTASLPEEEKVAALKEFRRALFVSRSFFTAGESEDNRIERITIQLEDLGARKRSHISVEPPFQVHYWYQILSQVGFWGWIVAVLLLIFLGFTKKGETIKRPAVVLAAFAMFFFVSWLISLSLAS